MPEHFRNWKSHQFFCYIKLFLYYWMELSALVKSIAIQMNVMQLNEHARRTGNATVATKNLHFVSVALDSANIFWEKNVIWAKRNMMLPLAYGKNENEK